MKHLITPFYFQFSVFSTMAFTLSTISNQTAGQRGLKQNLFLPLFTQADGLQTKVGVAQFFGESGKVVRHIHGNGLPRSSGLDLVTIHYRTKGLAYAVTA